MKTFAEHLQELRTRLFICLSFVALGSIIGFLLHKPIEQILQKPLGQNLYYSNPAGGLGFVMQIALCVGILLALPVILYQLVQFIRPAVKLVGTKQVIALIFSSLALIVLGVVYAYIVSLPAALHFLVTFNSDNVKALISVNDYLKFLFAYVIGMVVAFQIPLMLYFANKIKRFPPGAILNMQRPAIAGAIIFAGIATPTVDPINQMLVAVPIILLFQIGGFSIWLYNRINKPLPKFELKNPNNLAIVTNVTVGEIKPSIVKPITDPLSNIEDQPKIVEQSIEKTNIKPRPLIVDVFAPAH